MFVIFINSAVFVGCSVDPRRDPRPHVATTFAMCRPKTQIEELFDLESKSELNLLKSCSQ